MAAITVEGLELTVKTSADTAAESVDKLIRKLGELKEALTGKIAKSNFVDDISRSAGKALDSLTDSYSRKAGNAVKKITDANELAAYQIRQSVSNLTKELNKPIKYKGLDEVINKSLGIGNASTYTKDDFSGLSEIAKDEADAAAKEFRDTYTEEIMKRFTIPASIPMNRWINKITGVNRGRRKSAELSGNAINARIKQREWQQLLAERDQMESYRNAQDAAEEYNRQFDAVISKKGFLKRLHDAIFPDKSSKGAKGDSSVADAGEAIKEAIDIPTTPLEALKMKAEELSQELLKAAESGDKLKTAALDLQLFDLESKIDKFEGAEELKKQLLDIYKNAKLTRDGILQVNNAVSDAMLKNALSYQNPAAAQAAMSGKAKALAAIDAREAEKAANESLMNDLKTAGASEGMLHYAQAQIDAGKSASSLRDKLLTLDTELKAKKKDADNASAGIKNLGDTSKEAGDAIEDTGRKTSKSGSSMSKFMSSIGRIARTLVIRTALKSLMKEFSSSWEAAYEYSNHMGGEFAKALNNARGAVSQVTTSLVKTFAPVLTALTPLINHITSAITFLCEGIQSLISLLGISSELFGATAADINKYADGAGNASDKNKNMLASFDELNVIQSETSGGSGSGSSGKKPTWKQDIENELGFIAGLLVDEGLIAAGLILAFSGHVPVGVGLMAVGAAGIAKKISTQWGGLTDDVKAEVAELMIAVGNSELAVGAVLAFAVPSKRALGIGLMVAGLANNIGGLAIAWTLSDSVKKQVGLIEAIVGGAFLAVGAILAFAVPSKRALGIGLMAAGALNMGAAAALNWNGIIDALKGPIGAVTAAVSAASLALGAILTFSGTNIPVGIGLMAAGAVGLGTTAALNWNGIVDALKGPIGLVTGLVSGALLAVGAVLTFTGANIPLGIGLMAAGGVGLVAAIAPNWSGIVSTITGVFNKVKDGIVSAWTSVTSAISNAWNTVSKWWQNGIGGWISRAWDTVKSTVSSVWTGIKTSVTNAWDTVSKWWQDGIGGKISNAWEGVKTTLTNVWDSVKKSVKDSWDTVKEWWENSTIGQEVEKVWGPIRDKIVGVWNKIKEPIERVYNYIKKLFGGDDVHDTDYNVNVNYNEGGNASSATREMLDEAFGGGAPSPQKSAFDSFRDSAVADRAAKSGTVGSSIGSGSSGVTFSTTGPKLGSYTNSSTIEPDAKIVDTKPDYVFTSTGSSSSSGSGLPKKKTIINSWAWGAKNAIKTVTDEIASLSAKNPLFIKGFKLVTEKGKADSRRLELSNLTKAEVAWLRGNGYNIPLGASKTTTDKVRQIRQYAEGGYGIPSGDLFLANDRGPELVGQIGNRTAVANQEQIISGISRGVQAAMRNVEDRLARIERYAGITAEKDNTVRLTPSVGLGRINAQSAAMYNAVTGK